MKQNNIQELPSIVQGGIFTDSKGNISHVNEFGFERIKRFYIIEHPSFSTIRAWQGHQIEKKWFYVVNGSFCVAWVKIDDWLKPSKNLVPEFVILNESESKILFIPQGYANGLKALEPGSKIIVFSDMELKQSEQEKVRYPSFWWFDWNEIVIPN